MTSCFRIFSLCFSFNFRLYLDQLNQVNPLSLNFFTLVLKNSISEKIADDYIAILQVILVALKDFYLSRCLTNLN